MSPQGWRDVRAILAGRQAALAYLVVLAAVSIAIDAGVTALADMLGSFSSLSRHEFEGDVTWRVAATFGHASLDVRAALVLSIAAGAVLAGWLTTAYLVALGEGHYALRPPLRVAAWMSAWSLAFQLLGLALAGLDDHGDGGIELVLILVTLPALAFSQYAIVYGGRGLAGSYLDSLRMFRARPRSATLALVALVLITLVAGGLFAHGFDDATHVQPGYLVSWELLNVLLTFASDAVLLTMYRESAVSAGGSAGRPAAPPSSTASG